MSGPGVSEVLESLIRRFPPGPRRRSKPPGLAGRFGWPVLRRSCGVGPLEDRDVSMRIMFFLCFFWWGQVDPDLFRAAFEQYGELCTQVF